MEAHLPRLTCTVYLQTPKVFQSLMVLSLEPETIWRLSEEKATLRTSFVRPTKRRVVVPLKEDQETMGDLADKFRKRGEENSKI